MLRLTLLLVLLQISGLQGATCSNGLTKQADILIESNSRSLHKRRTTRAAAASKQRLWPNDTIPYFLDPVLSNSTRKVWHQGVEYWQNKTCLKFVERTDEKNYVHVHAGSGCCSYVGRVGGGQKLVLGEGCGTVRIVLHEIGHAIGFWHEHSRPDRDDFVSVLLDNVLPLSRSNFRKYSSTTVDSRDQPFDFDSIMMYDSRAFSKNSQTTIHAKVPGMHQLVGWQSRLSAQDILQTNLMYKCPGIANGDTDLLFEQEGSILSQNYPNSYPPSHSFKWVISTDPGPHGSLSVIFQDFSVGVKTESSVDSCEGDYLEIRRGTGPLAPYLVKLCGSQVPDVMTLSSGSLFITLHSTDNKTSHSARKFHLRYKADNCSAKLTALEDSIQSPGYPGKFPPDINCVWHITVPDGYNINLTFTDFEFSDVDSRQGCLDYLEIRESDEPLSTFVGRYCGRSSPGSVWAARTTLRVSMHSGTEVQRALGRFSAHYVAVDIDECAEDEFLCDHACFNLPGSYSCGCYRGYEFARGTSRKGHCLDVDECEDNNGGCSHSCTNTEGSYFCQCPKGYYLNDTRTCLDSNECKLSICSQQCINTPGSFRCSCRAGFILDDDQKSCILAIPMCTGTLTVPVGTFSSPTIPSWFRGAVDCHWTIIVREKYTIGLYLSLSWPRQDSCRDFLELTVDEGLGIQSLQLCGKQDVEGLGLLHFKSNKLRVRYHTEAPYPGRFRIRYHMRPKREQLCGGDLTSAAGVLQSPHHPSQYPGHATCVWRIHGAEGKRIQLQFEAFELEVESRCLYDRLDIQEKLYSFSKPRALGRFCGNKTPPLISTAAREVWVKFHSDGTVHKSGFKATYSLL